MGELEERGWTVWEDVIGEAECTRLLRMLRADDELQHAHSALAWELRADPRLVGRFQDAWGCEALLASFEGFGIRPAGQRWSLGWHVDQGPVGPPQGKGPRSFQGVLALTAVSPRTGGTQVLEGSHVHHAAVCARASVARADVDEWEFVPVARSDPVFREAGVRVVQPRLRPGSVLVWDSRTVHRVKQPSDPTSERAVAYVSMQPRHFAPEAVLLWRRRAYTNGVATTHWCDRCVSRGETRRRPPQPYSRAPANVRALVG